jgi:Aminoglycoside adenylyltransferase, C-terminal domain
MDADAMRPAAMAPIGDLASSGLADGPQAAFARAVGRVLSRILGAGLEGVYVTGSLALGDYVDGASDVDMLVAVGEPLGEVQKRLVAAAVLRLAEGCPARGLELVVYSRARLRGVERSWWQEENGLPGVSFELDVNGGPGMPVSVALSPGERARHWYVLDVSIAREHAVVVSGPPAQALLPRVPRPLESEALGDALAWYASRLPSHPSSVLTGCRAWRRAVAGEWSSKREAVQWVWRRVPACRALVNAALERYETRLPMPSTAAVVDFLWDVRGRLVLAAA